VAFPGLILLAGAEEISYAWFNPSEVKSLKSDLQMSDVTLTAHAVQVFEEFIICLNVSTVLYNV
jgi:hypothetical protein